MSQPGNSGILARLWLNSQSLLDPRPDIRDLRRRVATVVGAVLLALAAIEVALGAPGPPPPLRWFDASAATLTPETLTPVAGCGGCAPPNSPA